MVVTITRPGSDRRLQQADRKSDATSLLDSGRGGYRRQDDLEDEVDEIIQQAMCRRLEAATNGRLTFEGDRVVRKA